ncbi:hypothetical protein SLI_0034 [Streptomyces lividans 1326]|uniref:Uncharacterized protein n=1 Tax=Streptomyces lividans 1326 TaxID=1200984 RepID=A0A7U9DPT2_STRLI|nr:hypothetical protein SLI_0034 [Streptomyces lividans 1326]
MPERCPPPRKITQSNEALLGRVAKDDQGPVARRRGVRDGLTAPGDHP